MDQTKRHFLTRENFGIVIGLVVSLALAAIADRRGMPHKWHTAIFGTTVPFGVVVFSYQAQWRRTSFWAALAMCLGIHVLAIWVLFEGVLASVQTIGILLWLPFAFIEVFVLLVAIKHVEEKLTAKTEDYKLD